MYLSVPKGLGRDIIPFVLIEFCFHYSLLVLIFYQSRAGRTPYELEQLLLLYVPDVLTFIALVELLQFGERDHQLVAVFG